MGHKIKPQVCEGCKVPKGWGRNLPNRFCGSKAIRPIDL
tara:strand:- start:291 stop:407 length:117 start_codon:yes stop_codon:yes gene_type:complete